MFCSASATNELPHRLSASEREDPAAQLLLAVLRSLLPLTRLRYSQRYGRVNHESPRVDTMPAPLQILTLRPTAGTFDARAGLQ